MADAELDRWGPGPVLDALRGAGTDIWEWDPDTDALTGNNEFTARLGHPPEARPRTQAAYDRLIHPEDLSAYREAFRQHERGELARFACRYRMRAGDGSWRWVEERGCVVDRHPDGRPRRVIGTMTEITAQLALLQAAAHAQQRLEGVARHVPGLLFQFRRGADGSASFPYVSERCQALLGLEPDALQRDAAAMLRLVDRDERAAMLASIAESARTLAPWQLGFALWRHGERRHLRGSATPQREDDGAVLWHGYIEDVSDRLALEQAQRDKLAAEAASRSKTEFLSHMSHELRTPLNAVLGFAQLLEIDRDNPPTASQREKLQLIRASGAHLLQMIGDLLDLTRIETGQYTLDLEPVALPPLVDEVRRMLASSAAAAAVTLPPTAVAGDAAALPPAWADRVRLRQVLLNLVGNAIKYNRRGARALVRLGVDDAGWPWLAVEDEGQGIAADELPHLFEPFFRGRHARGTVEGAGIGLAVTRSLVDAMGGRIEVDSVPGVGSRFTVYLPRAG